jgi:hypothetical protein
VSALLPAGQHYTTDLDHVTRFPTAGSPLAFVCDGEGVCVPDVLADPRLAAQAETLRANGLRSVVLAPLWAGRGWRAGTPHRPPEAEDGRSAACRGEWGTK